MAAVDHPYYIDRFGVWSYCVVLTPYLVLLLAFTRYYRIIWRFESFKFYFGIACLMFTFLGMGFEWMAQMFRAWTFPEGRYLAEMRIPIFGWITGHKVPVEEIVWIIVVIPLFYYLYLWATTVFYDIVYVVDDAGKFYKREERWVGFLGDTHISVRPRGQRGRENEKVLRTRRAGFVARGSARWRKKHESGNPPVA